MQSGSYPNYNRDPLWPSGWKETEMHTFLGELNKFRNGIINKDGDAFLKGGMKFLYSAGNALVFKRGNIIVFTTNVGFNGTDVVVVTSDTSLTAGTEMIDGLSNSTVTVGNGGAMTVTLSHGMPMVFYPKTDYSEVVPSTKLTATQTNSTTSSSATASNSSTGSSNTGSTAKSQAQRRGSDSFLQDMGIFGLWIAFALGVVLF